MTKRLIRIAHSPDSDDAFMFYALKSGRVSSPKFEFEIERRDIEELNRAARDEIYDITAVSIHAYAYLSDRYALLASGMSMAEKDYGPMVVVRPDQMTRVTCDGRLRPEVTVAIPGEWTTAALVLRLLWGEVKRVLLRFDEILPAVKTGKVAAGLLIHEGQMQYEREGLVCVLRLIDGWNDLIRTATPTHPRTHAPTHRPAVLPLPLGGNAVKKALGYEVMGELSALVKESILWAMNHRDEARDYARQFKRDLTAEEADRYLDWYANHRTADVGHEGRLALRTLFEIAHEKGLLPKPPPLEII